MMELVIFVSLIPILGILLSGTLFSGHYYFPSHCGGHETDLKCKTEQQFNIRVQQK